MKLIDVCNHFPSLFPNPWCLGNELNGFWRFPLGLGFFQTLILTQEAKHSPMKEQRGLLGCLQIEHEVILDASVLCFESRDHRETMQPEWQL